jgi:hypothetical protein
MRRVDFSTTSWIFRVCRFFLPEEWRRFFFGRSMGVSVASIKTTSNARPPATTAVRPGNRKDAFGQRVFAPFDVAVRRAFADPASLPDMKIGPVFAPIFERARRGCASSGRVAKIITGAQPIFPRGFSAMRTRTAKARSVQMD